MASSRDSHFSRRRNIQEFLDFDGDDSGYVDGKVFMIWPPRNRTHRINLEVVQDSAPYRFEVEVPYNDGITFRPHERVSLALRGVRVERRKDSSAPHYFPIVLRFPSGVIFKYLSGSNADKVIDTWEGNTDEWYNPVHSVSDAVTVDASEVHRDSIPTEPRPPVPIPPPANLRGGDGASTAQPHQMNTERLSRPSRPKRKKRKVRKEGSTFPNQLTNDTNGPCPLGVATSCNEHPQTLTHAALPKVSDAHTELPQVSGHASRVPSMQEKSQINISSDNGRGSAGDVPTDTNVSTVQLQAGVRTQRGDIFTALGGLKIGHPMVNVIGIVTSVNPEKKTRTSEWCRSFTLVDPSTVDSPRKPIMVNCFQKKYPEWLPQVQKDDVVILRKLKVVEFNGDPAAIGYSDKLRWAVYDPVERYVRPPIRGDAPEKEIINDGMGYEFSPYWEPFQDSTELEYCQRIGEWWKAKHQLKGDSASMVECSSARKQHLKISEASPDRPPTGFFNCTVEVLQKFSKQGGAATVYVTDYTANALVYPVQAAWCPPKLHDCVLQCSMWDDAKNIAMMMNPGEYWYLHNVRAKWNPYHYMEGTMRLAEKVIQLDETKLEVHPYLRALLERKNKLELVTPNSGSATVNIFPEMLLQDVEGTTSFLTCVVELLHCDLNSRDGHFIYVTDYTFNPDLPTTTPPAVWAYNLEHRVLKIRLDDVQAKISSDIRPGSIYVIHNLRVKSSNPSVGMYGCLGGEDPLIHSVDDLSSRHAQALHRNREKWKREISLNGLTTLSNGSHGEAHGSSKQPTPCVENTSLQEALRRPAPAVFSVPARAMDYFPFSLEDACVLRCTKCDSSPPPSFKQCPRCDDMMETHSKWFYCLYILLQDEQGDELIVSLSGKECTVLQDVEPTDFRCDQVVFRRFLTKLDPILGNLRDVHVAWSGNEHKAINSPLMIFTIESWDVGNETGYSLLHCIPA